MRETSWHLQYIFKLHRYLYVHDNVIFLFVLLLLSILIFRNRPASVRHIFNLFLILAECKWERNWDWNDGNQVKIGKTNNNDDDEIWTIFNLDSEIFEKSPNVNSKSKFDFETIETNIENNSRWPNSSFQFYSNKTPGWRANKITIKHCWETEWIAFQRCGNLTIGEIYDRRRTIRPDSVSTAEEFIRNLFHACSNRPRIVVYI